jgi:hypothetical protein
MRQPQIESSESSKDTVNQCLAKLGAPGGHWIQVKWIKVAGKTRESLRFLCADAETTQALHAILSMSDSGGTGGASCAFAKLSQDCIATSTFGRVGPLLRACYHLLMCGFGTKQL